MGTAEERIEEIISKNTSDYCRFLLGKARHLMFKARQKNLASHHISPQAADILFILYNLGYKATLAELAECSLREINTLSLQMFRMEKRGLVKRTRGTKRTSPLTVELTEESLDTCNYCNKMTTDKAIMSALSLEERKQLISLLKKIISSTEKYK